MFLCCLNKPLMVLEKCKNSINYNRCLVSDTIYILFENQLYNILYYLIQPHQSSGVYCTIFHSLYSILMYYIYIVQQYICQTPLNPLNSPLLHINLLCSVLSHCELGLVRQEGKLSCLSSDLTPLYHHFHGNKQIFTSASVSSPSIASIS